MTFISGYDMVVIMNDDEFKQYLLALKLIAKQKEYIQVLLEEADIASICGWKFQYEVRHVKIKKEMMAIDIQIKDVYSG